MMQLSTMPLKIAAIVALISVLIFGWFLFKNHEKWFGNRAPGRGETSGERSYTKMQVFVCWLISVKLLITLILLL